MDPTFDYQFRLILVGDTTVGKSSILKYFNDGFYNEACEPTVGVDFSARLLDLQTVDRTVVKLQLWDTAGQERFRSITKAYYRNSVGVLLVYDVTNHKTFDNIPAWLEEAQINIGSDQAVFLVVGHKCDSEDRRQVSEREGQLFAQAHDIGFIETSAVTGKNINEAFLTISRTIYSQLKSGRLHVSADWSGIKPGYGRAPRGSFSIEEDGPPRQPCRC